MERWNTQYPGNPKGVQTELNSYSQTYQQNLNSTLTPQQRAAWGTMTGSRFDFPADSYFQNSAVEGTAANPEGQ